MPTTTRACVKASIVYLCLGCLLGALLLSNRWVLWWPGVYALRESHIVMLVVGWLTQLILGVAWWLFPPLRIGLRAGASHWERHGQTQRGSEPLFWATFAGLNAGVLLRSAAAAVYGWTGLSAFDVIASLSPLLLLAAALAFVANVWTRVRVLGKAR